MKQKILDLSRKIKEKISLKSASIMACASMLVCKMNMNIALAADSDRATNMFNCFMELAVTWLIRIGGVVAFIGAIMFALGWQREDAEGKTRGLQTMIAGALVMAIAAVGNTMFFNI